MEYNINDKIYNIQQYEEMFDIIDDDILEVDNNNNNNNIDIGKYEDNLVR